MLLGAALFISHYLMDFWIHGYDNYVYYSLRDHPILFKLIDFLVWSSYIAVSMSSYIIFSINIYANTASIVYVILDSRTRPIHEWMIILWTVISTIAFSLGIRIVFSGFSLKNCINLSALYSLNITFSSILVIWFASFLSVESGKGPENAIDDPEVKEKTVVLMSAFIMFYVLVTNAFSKSNVPIGFIKFFVFFTYNTWAMHWMWKRY